MNIITEIKNTNFPLDSFIVVGSGLLIALGIKDGHDIDLVVIDQVFKNCLEEGWEQIAYTYPERLGQIFLRKGIVELYRSVGMDKFDPTFAELQSRAVIIDGIAFASLQDILNFKRQYIKNNSKHLKDIKLIENYMGSQGK